MTARDIAMLKRTALLAELYALENELNIPPQKRRVLVLIPQNLQEMLTDIRNTAYNQNVEEGDGNPVGS